MIYQTGTAANVNVLMGSFATFLTGTCGYTQNLAPTTQGLGLRAHYQITTPNGNTLFANFRSFRKEAYGAVFSPYVWTVAQWTMIDGFAMNLSKAYAGTGVNWDVQGGHPTSGDAYYNGLGVYAGALDNIPAYHFFYNANPHQVIMVLEWALGFYSYIIWGEPDPAGAGVFSPNNGYFYTGSTIWYGPFHYTSTSPMPNPDGMYQGIQPPHWWSGFFQIQSTLWVQHNQFFQLDPTLHRGANGWLGPADDTSPFNTRNTTYAGGTVGNDMPGLVTPLATLDTSPHYRVPKWMAQSDARPARRSANAQTGVAVFLPHYFFWMKSFNNAVFLGSMKDFFHVYTRDLTPGQIITLGADQWIVFPYNTKSNPFDPDWVDSGYRSNKTFGMGMAIKMN